MAIPLSSLHFLVPAALFAFAATAFGDPLDRPGWWANALNPVLTGDDSNNKGPVSIGQSKWMVSAALLTLEGVAPALANQIRSDLEGVLTDHSDRLIDLTVPETKTQEWKEKQQAPLLLGQLKAIAKPFYDRINAATAAPTWLNSERTANGTSVAGTHLPWTTVTTDDSNMAIATIGQLKAVFSLRFEKDSDTDGIQDLAEWLLINQSTTDTLVGLSDVTIAILSPAQFDTDGDGKTSLTEIPLGLNPAVKDNPKVMLQVRVE
jgi:hypothetical protein